jgi:hypothetical protein
MRNREYPVLAVVLDDASHAGRLNGRAGKLGTVEANGFRAWLRVRVVGVRGWRVVAWARVLRVVRVGACSGLVARGGAGLRRVSRARVRVAWLVCGPVCGWGEKEGVLAGCAVPGVVLVGRGW